MKRIGWITIALALSLAGCGSEESEAAEETETPAAESPPEATEEEAVEEEAAEGAEEGAAEEAPAEEAEAAEEGEAEAEGEGTYCEQAFEGVQQLRAQLEEQMGGENQAPPLDREAYLESCNQLPEGAQQCMIMSYSVEHQEECAQFSEQIQGVQQGGN